MKIRTEQMRFGGHLVLPVVAFLVFYALLRMPYPSGWDEGFYMSQLSSAALDHDLMLQNDLLMFNNPISEKFRSVELLNSQGYHLNAFSVGPGLFFSVPVGIAYMFGADRFGENIQRAIAIWAAVFWFLALAAVYDLLKLLGIDRNTRFLTLMVSVFSTPIVLYGTRFYLTAHFLSTVLIAFSLYLWVSWFSNPDYLTAWAMGLVAGSLVVTRWESGLFFVSVLYPLIRSITRGDNRKKHLTGISIAVFASFLVVLVQLTAWKLQFGTWFLMPQGGDFMKWTSPALLALLVSGFHGLVPWAPGLLIGAIGLVMLYKKTTHRILKQVIPGLAIYLLIQCYISSVAWDWWAGSSYGPRRLTLLWAPVALGWGFILGKRRWWVKLALVSIMMIWGFFTLSAFRGNVDDLTLLFTGHPDAFRPARLPVTPDMQKNRWVQWKEGFRRMRVPGFALDNQPGNAHRRSGLIILTALCFFTLYMRRKLLTHKPLRSAILTVITGYIVILVIWMNATFPTNEIWREHWRDVVKHSQFTDRGNMPPGYLGACKAVMSRRWIQSPETFVQSDKNMIYDDSLPGLTLNEIASDQKDHGSF